MMAAPSLTATPSLTVVRRDQVLLVEDNDDIRFLLRFWLDEDERCGQVFEAATCADAVRLASTQAVDAMVVDFMLTGGTIDECLPALRAARPNARIVVYTANLQVARQAGVLAMGADVLVEKMSVVVEDVVDLVLAHTCA
jgi:DNA-binding response OmpR family regulator